MRETRGEAAAVPVLGLFRGASARRAWQWVVVFSVLLRVGVLLLLRGMPVASDAADYIRVARQMLAGEAFVPYWPPGVPLLLAPLLHAGASETMLRAAMLLFWLLCCWGIYRLMEGLGAAGVAWLVLLVFSLLPDAVQMSLEPMTQMPAAALLVVALGSTVRMLRGWGREAVLLGVSLGLLCLMRPSTAPLVLGLPLAVAGLTRRWRESAVSLVLACLLVGLWVRYAHEMTGRWVINTANSVNLFYGNNAWTPDYRTWYFGSHAKVGTEEIVLYPGYAGELEGVLALPELDRPAAFQALAVSYVEAHPGRFLWRSGNRVRAFFGFDTFSSAALARVRWLGVRATWPCLLLEVSMYLLLVGPAIFYLAAAPGSFWRIGAAVVVAGAVVLYGVPYWLTMSHPTYHFPVLLPLAALGAAAWGHGSSVRHMRRGWIAVGILLLIQVEWVWQASATVRGGS